MQVPVKFVVGDGDIAYNFPRIPEYLQLDGGGFKEDVPLLDVACLLGLPLAGEAVGPSEPAGDWHVDLAQRFNHVLPGGVHPDDVRRAELDRHGLRAQWLRQFEVIEFY